MDKGISSQATNAGQRQKKVPRIVYSEKGKLTPDQVAELLGPTLSDWHETEARRFVETVSECFRLGVK